MPNIPTPAVMSEEQVPNNVVVPNHILSAAEQAVLFTLLKFPDGLSKQDLGVAINGSTSTAYRYLKTLKERGFVETHNGPVKRDPITNERLPGRPPSIYFASHITTLSEFPHWVAHVSHLYDELRDARIVEKLESTGEVILRQRQIDAENRPTLDPLIASTLPVGTDPDKKAPIEAELVEAQVESLLERLKIDLVHVRWGLQVTDPRNEIRQPPEIMPLSGATARLSKAAQTIVRMLSSIDNVMKHMELNDRRNVIDGQLNAVAYPDDRLEILTYIKSVKFQIDVISDLLEQITALPAWQGVEHETTTYLDDVYTPVGSNKETLFDRSAISTLYRYLMTKGLKSAVSEKFDDQDPLSAPPKEVPNFSQKNNLPKFLKHFGYLFGSVVNLDGKSTSEDDRETTLESASAAFAEQFELARKHPVFIAYRRSLRRILNVTKNKPKPGEALKLLDTAETEETEEVVADDYDAL